jgi:hypothetical protein
MNNDLLIGGFSGIISRTITAPLELWKLQKQNFFIPNSTFKDVLQKEGFRYLWKGNFTNCMRIFPQYSINFAVFQKSQQNLKPHIQNEHAQNVISGSIAGLTAMSIIYPLETIRSRLALQTNKSHYSGIIDALFKTSIRDKYRGLGMSLLGFAPYNGFNFAFFYYYKNLLNQYSDRNDAINLVSGGLSGMTAVSITYPSDLIRRRLQLQGFDKTVPRYNGIIDCISVIMRREGLKGLYRGLFACYIKIFPTAGLQFWCIEKGKGLLKDY